MSPSLTAQFLLNEKGEVITLPGKKFTHYKIRLSVNNCPTDAVSVTYQLHESYKNPIRVVPRGVPNFQEDLFSYGDYDIQVCIQLASCPYSPERLTFLLSEALQFIHNGFDNESVRKAMQSLRDH